MRSSTSLSSPVRIARSGGGQRLAMKVTQKGRAATGVCPAFQSASDPDPPIGVQS